MKVKKLIKIERKHLDINDKLNLEFKNFITINSKFNCNYYEKNKYQNFTLNINICF